MGSTMTGTPNTQTFTKKAPASKSKTNTGFNRVTTSARTGSAKGIEPSAS